MIDQLVREEYRRINDKIAGGRLYGQPIDPDDKRQMVVAAYHCGAFGPIFPPIPAEAVQKRIEELLEEALADAD